jgi:hypothetical protein
MLPAIPPPSGISRLKPAAARIGRPTEQQRRNQCGMTPSVDTSVDAARISARATNEMKSSEWQCL